MTKKSEWNLLKSVENRIDQIQLLRPYTTPWNEGVSDLCAEIEAKLKCPHITGNPEGGQWCQLAESSVTAMGNEIAKLKEELEACRESAIQNINIGMKINQKLEAAEDVVDAGRWLYNACCGTEIEGYTQFKDMRIVLNHWNKQMKDDSLGEKSDNTPQL